MVASVRRSSWDLLAEAVVDINDELTEANIDHFLDSLSLPWQCEFW